MNSISRIAPSKKSGYAPMAVSLHWLLAILIVGMIALGWYMLSIEDTPGGDWYFMLHKSIGIVLAFLVLIRIMWRFGHRPDSLPDHFPRWQTTASKVTHWLLYVAMFTMPVVGIAGALLGEADNSFFGVVLPRVISPNQDISEWLFSLHSTIAWVFAGLIFLHVAAALKHLIRKDDVFQRMWPSKNSWR